MPFGALLASIGKFKSRLFEAEFSHSITAFGGGALLSAVALVLVPYGIAKLDPLIASTCLLVGGFIFMMLDVYLLKFETPASQLVAMLLDFIPESMALGTAFAIGSTDAALLAALITLQNIPEGFNAYRELNSSYHFGPKKNHGHFLFDGISRSCLRGVQLSMDARPSYCHCCDCACGFRRYFIFRISRYRSKSKTRKTLVAPDGRGARFCAWHGWSDDYQVIE